jgi:NAD(P)-dependent dehydrogenase (short-subunit alcohol dehydrogenase family)
MSDLDTSPTPDYGKLLRMDGKVFVVFGAGAGMGRQTAHALAQMGAKVVCIGRGKEATEKVAAEIGGLAILGDMSVRADAEAVFARIEADYGRLDGVVDIIGMNQAVKLMDLRDEHWTAMVAQNLLHAVHAIQLGGPMIAKSGGGSITLVGSFAGMAATSGSPHYGAVKAGLHQLTRLAGIELASSNVRVNAVVPGLTATPKLVRILGQERLDGMAGAFPLGRIPQSADIAGAILFLASGLANNVTSQLVLVDGGVSVRAASPLG